MPTPPTPFRQIRAVFDDRTVRVYQAYRPEIGLRAVEAGTFVSPFKRDRMTWIKPSFTWMMYRCGWGKKPDQEVVLGIDLRREGFEWALAHSAASHFDPSIHATHDAWKAAVATSPVRIQWDPERSLQLAELPFRSLQIGIGGAAVDAYVDDWIVAIHDVTPLASRIDALVASGDLAQAEALRPIEQPYPLPAELAQRLCGRGE